MRVLLVEDHEVKSAWREILEVFGVEVHEAATPEEALEKFGKYSDWIAIFLDGCIGGEEFNCLPVLAEMLRSYAGIIVATSDKDDLRCIQVEKGCNWDSGGKQFVPHIIPEIVRRYQSLRAA